MCFFVKIFCCCVYFVSKETRKRHQHNDKEWKFKEQHAKCGKILRVRKDTLAPVVSTLRGRATPSPPPFRRLCLRGHARTCSVSGRTHMRVLPPGTLCPTTSAPWLILSSSGNCSNHTILVTLLISVDFFVFFVFWAFG